MQRNLKINLPALHAIARWLARPVLLHWVMPYLMLLIAAGTVAQKYIGLYESQRLFFSSFICWLGPVPLPGGRSVIALLLISLLAKLLYASPWQKAKAGIFITHLGVLLLLLGGLVTASFSTEGFVVLQPGQTVANFYDYHRRLLIVSKNHVPVKRIPVEYLVKKETIQDAQLPFAISINSLCRNCTMAERSDNAASLKGAAAKITLVPLTPSLEDERNFAGAEITVFGAGGDGDGTYVLFEPMEKQARFAIGADTYDIALSRADYPLPFNLQLIEATKEVHPGTHVPRSYTSTVMLTDGEIKQRAVLTMNHPLRYKGYTVYQASFNEDPDNAQTQSVSFAVVQNSGRVFPYIASITLCLGLIVHLCLRLPTLIWRKPHAA